MEVYGLIGNPVGHSLSPVMQEAGFDAIGRNARYVTFEPPKDQALGALRGAATLGIRGLNVTIPFKEDVLDHVKLDDVAARIGAVNTIDLSCDPPVGYNTDVGGAMRAFDHHDIDLTDRRAVVVGAGGAARAITVGLIDAGATVTISNRTVSRAKTLSDELGGTDGVGLGALSEILDDASVLINATSVGMESDETIVPASVLHGDLIVMDAVYRPIRTRLLRDAEGVGATTIDGGWMLLFQGVEAFEQWTGESAPVSTMNEALRSQL